MNIVNAGSRYQVYGEDVRTYRTLPVMTYSIGYHPQMGFWLNKRQDLEAREEKVYGTHDKKVQKVFQSFKQSERNFGVILSGKKGIGKSLFARLIAEEAIEHGLPVIIVDCAIPGISDFLASIEQEVVVIFDEFEKHFAKRGEDHKDPQIEMLSLFDGMNNGKKLFVITCNNPKELNEFLINRPGRFHYHFTINCPSKDEVEAYMRDKLGDEFEEEIEKVIKLSQMADITYDCLRAIVFDLRQGYPLEETLRDLNINYERDVSFDITVRLSNGMVLTTYSKKLDLYSKEEECVRFYHEKNAFFLNFVPNETIVQDGILMVNPAKARISVAWDNWDDTMNEKDAEKMRDDFNQNVKVDLATLTKVSYSTVSKYVDV